MHLVKTFGVSPLLVEQIPLVWTALFARFDVKPALKVSTGKNKTHNGNSFELGAIYISSWIYSTERKAIYVVQRVGSFVHSAIQQLGDAELLYVPSHFIRGAA